MILKNKENKENNYLEFVVESDAQEFEDAVQKAYLRNKKQIAIPGFRKGKAPLAVIEGMYGPDVFDQDALEELSQPAFEKGITEGDVNFIGMPAIIDANVTEDRRASFTFRVELYPEVKLGQYKGIEVEKPAADVTDEELELELKNVQARNARKVSVDDRAAQMGDTANIDFEGFLDAEKTQPFEGGKGEAYDLELGSDSFVPGFEEQIVGMNIGESKDINITFPEQYVDELAGKDVVFTVKLNSITFPELPELDDEFAKDVSEFDTLAEYKDDLRKSMVARKEETNKQVLRNEVLTKAADNLEVEVPETMIATGIDEIIRNFAANYGISDPNIDTQTLASMLGIDENAMNTAIRPSAVAQTRVKLLLNAVIEEEKIEVTDEQAEEACARIAEQYGAKPEDIKSYFGMDYIKSEEVHEKAIQFLMDNAVIKEAKKAAKKAPAKKAAAGNEETEKKPAAKKAPAKKAADKAETEKKPAAKKADGEKKPAAKKTAAKKEDK